MLKTPDNIRARNAVMAIAGAHMRLPGFDRVRAQEAARRMETAVHDEQQMHVTVALAILMLKAMGILDANDTDRFEWK